MYNYITGKVVQAVGNTLVLENNGIGYEIGVSGNTLYDVCNISSTAKIYTYLYVREDTFALYGFSTLGEKTLFLRLIEISGVGPKLAMQILSGMDLNSLSIAIATGDIKTLSKIKTMQCSFLCHKACPTQTQCDLLQKLPRQHKDLKIF